MQPIICLMGPTATGKSDLALALTQTLPCEIISVDSVMVYRDMDIGSAKPDAKMLAQTPHHLINILDPVQIYSVGQFYKDVTRLIADIHRRGKLPLLVGGTMLYFKALLQGIAEMPQANPIVRAQLTARAANEGWGALHQTLCEVDPIAASKIKQHDQQRIQRALEVYLVSGKPISVWQTETVSPARHWQVHAFALFKERNALHQAIAMRFQQMLANGFLHEVEQLFCRADLHADLPAMRSVGYREAWAYLAKQMDYDTMVEEALKSTRQLAKRQMTWLRAFENLTWVTSDSTNLLRDVIEGIG